MQKETGGLPGPLVMIEVVAGAHIRTGIMQQLDCVWTGWLLYIYIPGYLFTYLQYTDKVKVQESEPALERAETNSKPRVKVLLMGRECMLLV